MLLHLHNSEGGDIYVAHLNREEAVNLVKNLSGALAENEDSDAFSISLGHPVAIEGQDDDEEIAG